MPVNLFFAFIISFLSLLLSQSLFPSLSLIFFAPYLAFAILRLSLPSLLFHCLFVGLLVDLFTSTTHFGMTGCAYALAARLLFARRYDLFEDNFSTFPIMTLLFSGLSALSERVLYFIFGASLPFSKGHLFSDFFLIPFADALYALCLFVLPWYVWKKVYKLFLKRRYNS